MSLFKVMTFAEIPIGTVFLDSVYSGMWMQKIGEDTARFQDGLVGICRPESIVNVPVEEN